MQRKTIGQILLVAGILLLVLSLLVDVTGQGSPGFGMMQISGTAVALVVAAVGLLLVRQRPKE